MNDKTTLVVDYTSINSAGPMDNLKNAVSPIPKTKHRIGLVLIIPADNLKKLERTPLGNERLIFINSDSFVQTIISHAFFVYDKGNNMCEIVGMKERYDMHIMISLFQSLPTETVLWVGTPIHDRNIIDLSEMYIKNGFSSPYLSDKSPLGHSFPHSALCMTKNNSKGLPDEKLTIKTITYLIKEYNNSSDSCVLKLKLSSPTVEFLTLLTTNGTNINTDSSFMQKELAGSFIVNDIDKNLIHTLEVDRNSIIKGTIDGVKIVNSMYNFHTHPISAYTKYNVTLGWPSAQDYVGFLKSALVNDTIVHYVATIEGIYVIMFHPEWARNFDELNDDVITYILDGKFTMRNKISDENIPWFLESVNSIKYKNRLLFVTKYLTWSNADSVVTVHYRKTGENCFALEDGIVSYNRHTT